MTVNAVSRCVRVPRNVDGKLYGTANLGACGTATARVINLNFTVSGWGQEVGAGGTITGPAPLAVFCDATETTHATDDSFRELGYHWDFGYATPSTPGTWTYSGKAKGNQVGGPIAAHVYETPGTYTLSIRAQDADGNKQDATLTVVVEDPDTVYAGAATVCISLAGNFAGAPAGASQTTTIPTTAASNTRYLFRAGENFSGTTLNLNHGTSGVAIDSFGSGSAPIIKQSFPARPFTNSSSQLAKVVISNCSMSAVLVDFGDYITCHRCDNWSYSGATLNAVGFGTNSTVAYYADNPPSNTNSQNSRWSRNVVFSECTINALPAGSYSAYVLGTLVTLIGNEFTGPQVTHCLRLPFSYKTFIAHNRLRSPAEDRHYIKIHALGADPFSYDLAVSASPASRYAVIADNFCVASNTQQWMAISPQNSQAYEIVQDVVAERNEFPSLGTLTPQSAVVLAGNRLAVRDSIISGWPSSSYYGVDTHTGGVGGLPVSATSPYYLPAGESEIDDIRVFVSPTGILPQKAGT